MLPGSKTATLAGTIVRMLWVHGEGDDSAGLAPATVASGTTDPDRVEARGVIVGARGFGVIEGVGLRWVVRWGSPDVETNVGVPVIHESVAVRVMRDASHEC